MGSIDDLVGEHVLLNVMSGVTLYGTLAESGDTELTMVDCVAVGAGETSFDLIGAQHYHNQRLLAAKCPTAPAISLRKYQVIRRSVAFYRNISKDISKGSSP